MEGLASVLHLIKQSIIFMVVFLTSRLLIIVLNIRRRRTNVPGYLLCAKRGCVRTLVVLGSGNYGHFCVRTGPAQGVIATSLICHVICQVGFSNTSKVGVSMVRMNYRLCTQDLSFPRTKGPYGELSFPRNESFRNFRSRDLSFPGTSVPGERKFPGTFVPRPLCSRELSFPEKESSWELSFLGLFVPGNFRSHICVRWFITANEIKLYERILKSLSPKWSQICSGWNNFISFQTWFHVKINFSNSLK